MLKILIVLKTRKKLKKMKIIRKNKLKQKKKKTTKLQYSSTAYKKK
jgi:hypothetical protein